MKTDSERLSLLKLLAVSLMVFILAACGGGGGGGGDGGSDEPITSNPPPSEPEPIDPVDPGPGPDPFEPVTINLSWQIPTTREDGSPLSMAELGGYEIYYYLDGASPGSDCCVVTVNSGSQDSVDVTLNQAGTWYFAIAAFDADGLESDLSDPVSLVIN